MYDVTNFSRQRLLEIASICGVFLLSITYYFAYQGNFNNILFWSSILLVGIPVVINIFDEIMSENRKILILFLWSNFIYIIHLLPSLYHFHFIDELYHFEALKLIYETGTLDVPVHFEISRYYPGLELSTLFLKYFLSIDMFTTSKILIWVIHSLIPIFLYLAFKKISSSPNLAVIGAFIYSTNPIDIFFHSVFSYETQGILFVTMIIYIFSKEFSHEKSTLVLTMLALILICSLVITHHFSSLMLLLLMISLTLIQYYNKIKIKNNSFNNQYSNLTVLTASIIFYWMIYMAAKTINYLGDNLVIRFLKIFELSFFGGERGDIFSSSLASSRLPYAEFIVDTFIYPLLIILLSFLGIYIIKNKNKCMNDFSIAFIVFGPILYLVALPFIPTSGAELAVRLWGFAYIGVSFLVAIALAKIKTVISKKTLIKNFILKLFLYLIIILIIFGGISIGDKPIHRIPDLLSPMFVAGSGSITTDVFYASYWFENKAGRYNNISGDRTSSTIFMTTGCQNAERWESWKAFLPHLINNEVLQYFNKYNINFIIIDNRIVKYLPELGTYFSPSELLYTGNLNYIRSDQNLNVSPLSKESLGKFSNSTMFYQIYSGGNIDILPINI